MNKEIDLGNLSPEDEAIATLCGAGYTSIVMVPKGITGHILCKVESNHTDIMLLREALDFCKGSEKSMGVEKRYVGGALQDPPLTECPECGKKLESEKVCKHCHLNVYNSMIQESPCQCQRCGREFLTAYTAKVCADAIFTRAKEKCPGCGHRYHVMIV